MQDLSSPDDGGDSDHVPSEPSSAGRDATTISGRSSSNSSSSRPKVEGRDIANILSSEGPIVKCVILRAPKRENINIQDIMEEDKKVAAEASPQRDITHTANTSGSGPESSPSGGDDKEGPSGIDEQKRQLFEDLVEETEIDTTPQKNEVEKVLGGPFTFIGQYESEGIVLMARRGLVEELEADDGDKQEGFFVGMKVSELRSQCEEWGVCMDGMLEKQDLIDALKKKEQELPLVNPHKLQPPLNNTRIRGDILILKVADVDEPLDSDESDAAENDAADNDVAVGAGSLETDLLHAPTNDDFFLPYTKEEYLKFASRTDIKPTHLTRRQTETGAAAVDGENGSDGNDDNDNGGDDDDDGDDNDDDGEFQLVASGMQELTEEEEKSAMLNIVMSELLRKFREENGRGPNSREVLEIRASVAEQLGMVVTTYEESQDSVQGEEAQSDRKRGEENTDNGNSNAKRVKFNTSLVESEEEVEIEPPNNDHLKASSTTQQSESQSQNLKDESS